MKKISKNKKDRIITYEEYLENQISFIKFVENGIAKIKVNGKEKLHTILKISGIDIFGCSQSDKELIYNSFAYATTLLKFPHKYIFSSSNPDLKRQIDFLRYKLEKSQNKFRKQLLRREIKLFKELETKHNDLVAYVSVFAGENEIKELQNSIRAYSTAMNNVAVESCQNNEYISVMHSLMNFNSPSSVNAYSSNLNELILPEKVTFSNADFKVGNKLVTCLKITDYPAFIDDLLFADLFNAYDVITTFDIEQCPPNVVNTLRKSLSEINNRGSIPQEVADRIDDATQFNDLSNLYQNISRGNEKLFNSTVRFYITSDTTDELKHKVSEVKNMLDNFGIKSHVEINCMVKEYLSMVSSEFSMQQIIPLHDTLKRQFPFYYQSVIDNNSYYFGKTVTGGNVLFNNFYKNSNLGRDSFDTIIVGSKGAGKSVTLKSMLQSNLIFNNKVMVIDVENEYGTMAKVLGGKVMNMTVNSIINVLQLYLTVDSKAENSQIGSDVLATNYSSELSRISTFFYQYYPSMTDSQNALLLDTLDTLYLHFGISKNTDITKLSPMEFPTFKDYYDYLNSICENDKEIMSLMQIVKPLSDGAYSSLFNGHSTVDISNNDFIVFNVKSIAEMDEKVYNAQLFNILTLMWSEVAKNYAYNKDIKNSWDIRHIVCLIDEAHRFINTRYKHVTDFIEKLVRRARKYYSGLWFATQNITDCFPSFADENSDKIKTIFSLCQYKIIMKQDNECVPILKTIFPQFTSSELSSVPTFSAGTMLMSISSGRQKVTVSKYIAQSDFLYIGNDMDVFDVIQKIYIDYYGKMSQQEVVQKLDDSKVYEHFVSVFTDEIYEYFGYNRNCSLELEKIIVTGISKLIEDLRKDVLVDV